VIKRHHPLRYRIFLSLTAWLIYCPLVFADGVRGLQEIYETPIPSQIRKNFNNIIETRKTCPECSLRVIDGEKFIDVYTKKFLVIGLSPDSFGGFWAVITVEGEPKSAFRLWLYDVDRDVYDLRSIEELPESLDKKLVQQLWGVAYRRYWL
jgi:hypothetical protein